MKEWIVFKLSEVDIQAFGDVRPTYVPGAPDEGKIRSGLTEEQALDGCPVGRYVVIPMPEDWPQHQFKVESQTTRLARAALKGEDG